MPIYEYECAKCGSFEHTQSIHDSPLTRCPTCRRKVQRLISRAAFHLKGGGWYADGYASSPGAKANGDSAPSSESSNGSADVKPKSDAAPPTAAAPEKKKKAKKADTSPV
jgi:putative FmdB family regulatory protein